MPRRLLTLDRNPRLLLLVAFLVWLCCAEAGDIEFAGYSWSVRSGQGGPGPNTWEASNVWLDGSTNLHLRISHRGGTWSCAEVTMRKRLGFGRYEFQITSRLDEFDDNVVLGLFNYPTGDVGPDATREIDIEFARWGVPANPLGNFTVWPVDASLKQVTRPFPIVQSGNASTHQFEWRPNEVKFRSVGGDPSTTICSWHYRPGDAVRRIAQQPMPVHLNLWLFKGRPPKNGQEVEVIVRGFEYSPD